MNIDWKLCLKVGVTLFALFLAITYWPPVAKFIGSLAGAALPLVVGCAIAYVVNILMAYIERRYFANSANRFVNKSRRPVCLLASFVLIVGIVVLLGRLVVPELKACADLLIAKAPGMMDAIVSWLESTGNLPENGLALMTAEEWEAAIEQIGTMVSSGFGNVMGSAIDAVTSVFSGVATAAIALIFSVYLLASKERLIAQVDNMLKSYMPAVVYDKMRYVLSVFNDSFHRYIVGQFAEAVILGVLCTIGMMILQIPFAAMTGAVIAFTALIPVAGAYIGAVVGALVILTVSPIKALVFLIFIVVLQQVEGNFIYPKVVGSSVGLPAIWVLAAVIIGGGVMGIAGMMLGVPIASAIYRLIGEDVRTRRKPAESTTA